ncbi:hypothetical protein V8G54_013073 [Vigna mungo]|uniref:Uncharacterized protein n=1 Tax=Vigna mungo TaxID=3915 RepID=A0AAQ3NV11_VIGMU
MEELEEEAWLFSTLSLTRSPKDEAGAPTDTTGISNKAIVFPKSLILGSFASDIYESEFQLPRMKIIKMMVLKIQLQQLMRQILEIQLHKTDPPSQTAVHVAC